VPATTDTKALPAGIGRYQPLAVLGAGAMGTVYKAHDPVINRTVAIKVVRTDALDPPTRADYLERFRLEVQAAGRCSHPAIVGVYDYLTEADNPSIVMEFVEGRTLQQVLRDPAARAALPFVPLLVQVLGGLAAAHRLGITHRDVKPANIMVTARGEAKLADFGIARMPDASHTQVGMLLGTPAYMAPEQVAGSNVDHRADLFAIGAILYETVAGRPPFAGRTMSETILRLTGPPPAAMEAVEQAGGDAYVPVLRRALAKPVAERFHSAEEFVAALQSAAAPGTQATVRTRTPPSTPAATLAGRWDPSLLQRVERALAQYVGPMARVVVSQAARQSATADELYQSLARSLQSTADRSAFLRSLGGVRVEPDAGPRTRAGQTVAGGTTVAGTGTISPEALAAAQTVLAFFVGPIARMMVRQAAQNVASPQDFIDRLCAHVSKPDELATLRRRLRAEVEPKLR